MFSTPKVLIIDVMQSTELRELVLAKYEPLHNDTYVQLSSEFYPINTLSKAEMERWYQEDLAEGHVDNFNDFITDMGLEIENWLLRQNMDYSSYDEILLKISW